MKLSKRKKALILAASGSVFVVLLLVFLTWLLRVTVSYLGLEFYTSDKEEIVVVDSVSTTGVIDGLSVGLQSIERSNPYQLSIVTYVANSGSLERSFNEKIEQFLNEQKEGFEDMMKDLNINQMQSARLTILSESIRSNDGIIMVDYNIDYEIPDIGVQETSYITIEVEG